MQSQHLIDDGELDDYNFGGNVNNLIPDQPQNAHSEEEVWKRVGEILYHARQCAQNSSAEPAWNTEVHARVLDLVLFGWREDRRLGYNDVYVETLLIYNPNCLIH
jgi:hypothetical protein